MYLVENVSLEFNLMINLSSTNLKKEIMIENKKIIQENTVNWERFLYLCSHHRVVGLVYYNLKKQGLLKFMENHIRHIFEYVTRSISEHNRITLCEVNKINRAFTENGIKAVLIKGVNLAESIYPHIFFRQFGDIDFLIQIEDITKACQVMRKLGYTQGKIDLTNDKVIPYTRKECLNRNLNTHEVAEFVKKNTNMQCPYYMVDINFSIMWQGYKRENSQHIKTTKNMINNAILYKDKNCSFYTLNLYDQIIELCCHLYSEAVYFCWHTNWMRDKSDLNLIKFCDIHEILLNYTIVWNDFITYVKNIELIDPVFYSLFLVNIIFGDIDIPQYIRKYVAKNNLINKFFDKKGNVHYWELNFLSRMEQIDKKCLYIERLNII